MDTRNKILSPDAAPRGCTVVTGVFDVVLAADARQLAEIRESHPDRPILVVVLPLSEELLPQRARAELVAALRMVDYVVAADHRDLEQLVAAIEPPEVIRFEAADAQRAQQLTEHVIDLFWHRKNR